MRTVAVLCVVAPLVVATAGSAAAEFDDVRVSGFAATPGGGWLLTYPNGRVDSGGGAQEFGEMAGQPLNLPVTGIASTTAGNGYWLVASDGGIFSFGDAPFFGSTGDLALNRAIVGMAATPSGNGYWLVASDGGIFSFGDARFLGSTGDLVLNRAIVGMAATPSGNGYWLVASDGGIFSFGDARFFGSTGDLGVTTPVVGMAATWTGRGYWLATEDGRVYEFGDATPIGEPVGQTFGTVIGVVARPGGDGYVVVDAGGHHIYGSDTGPAGEHHQTGLGMPVTEAIAADLIRRTNDERVARGLAPLAVSSALNADAAALAVQMSSLGSLQHLVNFSTLLPAHGATGGGENIAYTSAQDSAANAHVMWMQSDGHRRNMLNRGFDTIGIGASCSGNRVYVSMLLLRVGVSTPLDSAAPPQNPIVRSDSDPLSQLHCSAGAAESS